MRLDRHRRPLLLASASLLAVGLMIGSFAWGKEDTPEPSQLPDFANQKVIYEPAIGKTYAFTGVDALLLRPADLGPDWYFGTDPAAGGPQDQRANRRLVKATRAPGATWKADTCVMQTVTRWPTQAAAAADHKMLVGLIAAGKPRVRDIDGVVVTVLDTPAQRSAVFRRGLDVFNLNVCLRLATSDFSPAAADGVVEAAVRRSAG